MEKKNCFKLEAQFSSIPAMATLVQAVGVELCDKDAQVVVEEIQALKKSATEVKKLLPPWYNITGGVYTVQKGSRYKIQKGTLYKVHWSKIPRFFLKESRYNVHWSAESRKRFFFKFYKNVLFELIS